MAGGCALRDPGPSPMVCPSTPGGCAAEDAPWYRQDVTAMIPPPPIDPPAPRDPAATGEPEGAESTLGDPAATAPAAEPVTGPVVSSFAMPEDRKESAPGAGTSPSSVMAAVTTMEAGGNASASAAQTGTPDGDAPVVNVVRLPSDGLFEIGRSTLGPTGRRALDALADQLHGTAYTHIRVIAHTDRSGRAATNLTLSWQRARVVRDHLATRGIPGEVLDHEGRGSRDAVIDPDRCGQQKAARIRCLAPDRRVDIVVTRRNAP